MEARAIRRYIRRSPRKMRLVADLVRGLDVDQALRLLRLSPQAAARDIERTVHDAVNNLMQRHPDVRFDEGQLYIKAIMVDGGPMLKRIRPAPMGRAFRIRKRNSHLTVVVARKPKHQAQ
ncbi:MAG: 50S ribosomal protein L22 [Bacteroidetes bacterium]|nr:50S ribosomal protein L22 [Rhodothermia bacterium]MCS7154549.1 50S ribosomal protein L22 [Bacteroidota bacterium]MCX7906266.1 50S ribosomal protein L22 [Bacteroidota bacterium]MDW8137342.1 50S ribosomal protein L22 [Bacteroidota bacterium]MDW8285704.1 50S ribosomal protein L22 [Bacteroidota bacterium]